MLDKMKSFIVLSKSNSFTDAAKQLYCSQPTISNHITQLEEHFEAALVKRSSNAITLTKQGEVLLAHAKKIIALMEFAKQEVKEVDEQEVISIYMSNYIARYYFSNHFAELDELSPTSKLEVHSCCYNELKRSFKEQESNFAIMPIYLEDQEIVRGCQVSTLFEDEFVLVFCPDHLWNMRKVIYPRDFEDETLLVPQSIYLKQLILRSLEEKKLQVTYRQMGDFEMIKMSIIAGYGVAFLPHTAVMEEIREGKLCTCKVSSLTIKRNNGLVIRKGVHLSTNELLFCQNIKKDLTTTFS